MHPALEDASLARGRRQHRYGHLLRLDTAKPSPRRAAPTTCPLNASDNDDDGIPDSAEVSGSTFAGLDLFAMGARTSQPDIFVEVDYMNTTDPGVVPQRAALDKVAAAFED